MSAISSKFQPRKLILVRTLITPNFVQLVLQFVHQVDMIYTTKIVESVVSKLLADSIAQNENLKSGTQQHAAYRAMAAESFIEGIFLVSPKHQA